jgi:osmotically-inducible protein OsmY
LDLPIKNLQDEQLGKVWSLTLDIPSGRILSVIVISQGNYNIRNVVPAMALHFNPTRDGLVLNDTPAELENEPRYIFTAAAYGQDAYSREEVYRGPRTSETLAQGSSYRDVDQTVRINREIRNTGIDCRGIEVGTLNDRVTLRGTVATAEDKRRIGESAIRVSRLELVDNQILVGDPASKS